MVTACVRKHRLTKFVWVGLSCIQFCIFLVAVGQLEFKAIQSKNCNFALGIIYSVEVGILFLLSILIGYKTYCICREIKDFALHGNLPSERSKQWKKRVIISIWAMTLVYLCIDLFLSFFWRFNTAHKDLNILDKFDFINKWIQVVIFIIVSLLFLMSALLLRDLQVNLQAKKHPLIRTKRGVWVLFASYTAIWVSLLYSTYTQGLYDWQDFLSQVLSKLFFTIMKIQLFLILAY